MSERGRLDALVSGVRFGQFASVGAAGAAVDTATVLLLTTQLHVYRGTAKLVGAELAIVLMFFINDRWTFAAKGDRSVAATGWRFLKSNLVRAGGVLVATGVFVAVSGLPVELPVGGRPLWLVVANGVGIAVGVVVNYLAESLLTWRVGTG